MTRFEYLKSDLELCEMAKILNHFKAENITKDYDIEEWLCHEVKEEELYIVE